MNNQSEVMKKIREELQAALNLSLGLVYTRTAQRDHLFEALRLLDSAAPEGGQEAVAWAVKDERGTTVVFMSKRGADAACQRPGWQKPFPLYAAPQPAGLIPVSEVEDADRPCVHPVFGTTCGYPKEVSCHFGAYEPPPPMGRHEYRPAARPQQAAQAASPYPHLAQVSLQQHVPTTVSDRTTSQVAAVSVGYRLVPLSETAGIGEDLYLDAMMAFDKAVPLHQRGFVEWCIRMDAAIEVLAASPEPPSP